MMADTDSTFHILPRNERTPPRDAPARVKLAPGVLAGEYMLKAVLASGGHGAVYEAEHRILGRRAAVKVLHPHLTDQGEMLQRFVREARVVNQIRHPNIVDVYDFGMLPDGSPYYVMELLPGRTLGQLLQERGRLSPQRALAFLEPVCAALEAAHLAGVVHRDLKASNVAVVSEADPPVVKLLDFGIAKFIHPEPGQEGLTVAGQRLGTSQAMAPEQFRGGAIGPTTDIYALGVLLYQLLVGHYPFQSEDRLEVERMHLEAPAPRPSTEASVPPAVDAVVLRCLEKEADRRYPDVAAFREALREAVQPSSERVTALGRSLRAFALHAEVVLEDGAEDDEAYATVSEVLDALEQDLRAAGFVLAVQTGMALLGVRMLDEPSRAEPRALLETARELHRRAQERAAGTRVSVHACAHVGQVDARRGPDGLEVTGGPLADIAGWVVRDASGLGITPSAARACSLPLTG
ncbi:serine/threonine-protein kinase [Archangium violaceum]|uniref:serine/threonine-protein kinase n=1 Tax=Archangium violaceum TaxID=83451 RepID=UPI001EF708E6|nr:serine/threonine-protein kinase [Archangium violaceum]